MKYEKTAQRLRKVLVMRNIRAAELAERSGVNKSSISQYYNGTHKPSNIAAMKMSQVLGVNPMWLMGFDHVDMLEELNNVEESDNAVAILKSAFKKTGYYSDDFTDDEIIDIMKYAEFVQNKRG